VKISVIICDAAYAVVSKKKYVLMK